MFEISPAIERIAAVLANRTGESAPTLKDWFHELLADEDGHPATILERLKRDREAILRNAQDLPSPPAPAHDLYALAKSLSLQLRGEPGLTTEFLFLAVLIADADFGNQLLNLGLDPNSVYYLLRSPAMALEIAEPKAPEFRVPELAESLSAARIVDANANRSREAFRVLDDFARFDLNDSILTEKIKTLRHRLAEAIAKLPSELLKSARDTPGDVGTRLETSGEYIRTTPGQVAAINFQRLGESLRSLEEFGKILDVDFARAVERIRYETYTLEAVLLRRTTTRGKLERANLYLLLTGSQCVAALDWTIEQAALGGVDVVQLREKNLSDRDLLERAKRMREWTRRAGVLFMVNDRPDLARLVEADGVHLGQDDLPIESARRIVGPDLLIGISTHDAEQIRRAVESGADYLGLGPTFPSKTKPFDTFPGLDFLKAASDMTSLPLFALGGIDAENLPQVRAAGVNRIAVSAAIATADDPQAAARKLKWGLN